MQAFFSIPHYQILPSPYFFMPAFQNSKFPVTQTASLFLTRLKITSFRIIPFSNYQIIKSSNSCFPKTKKPGTKPGLSHHFRPRLRSRQPAKALSASVTSVLETAPTAAKITVLAISSESKLGSALSTVPEIIPVRSEIALSIFKARLLSPATAH